MTDDTRLVLRRKLTPPAPPAPPPAASNESLQSLANSEGETWNHTQNYGGPPGFAPLPPPRRLLVHRSRDANGDYHDDTTVDLGETYDRMQIRAGRGGRMLAFTNRWTPWSNEPTFYGSRIIDVLEDLPRAQRTLYTDDGRLHVVTNEAMDRVFSRPPRTPLQVHADALLESVNQMNETYRQQKAKFPWLVVVAMSIIALGLIVKIVKGLL